MLGASLLAPDFGRLRCWFRAGFGGRGFGGRGFANCLGGFCVHQVLLGTPAPRDGLLDERLSSDRLLLEVGDLLLQLRELLLGGCGADQVVCHLGPGEGQGVELGRMMQITGAARGLRALLRGLGLGQRIGHHCPGRGGVQQGAQAFGLGAGVGARRLSERAGDEEPAGSETECGEGQSRLKSGAFHARNEATCRAGRQATVKPLVPVRGSGYTGNVEEPKIMTMRARASWDEYFMAIARVVATRSTCDRKHVGAVIVREKMILTTGYNGSIRGIEHCDDVGHLMEDGHCVRTVHAEANAIVQAARNGVRLDGADIYVTASPCFGCYKLIANAGLTRIVFGEFYRDSRIFELSEKLGMKLDHLPIDGVPREAANEPPLA